MADPLQHDPAAALARHTEDAALLANLEELAAAAEQLRSALWTHSAAHGHRYTAALTGLALATVGRWRHEVPVAPVLRAAQHRRDG